MLPAPYSSSKVLAAIANGARLLTPQWVLDSVEGGEWAPADDERYRARCR